MSIKKGYPPPPAACKVIKPVPEENVSTSPSLAPDRSPGIRSAVIFASPSVISFDAPTAEGSASCPITILFDPVV